MTHAELTSDITAALEAAQRKLDAKQRSKAVSDESESEEEEEEVEEEAVEEEKEVAEEDDEDFTPGPQQPCWADSGNLPRRWTAKAVVRRYGSAKAASVWDKLVVEACVLKVVPIPRGRSAKNAKAKAAKAKLWIRCVGGPKKLWKKPQKEGAAGGELANLYIHLVRCDTGADFEPPIRCGAESENRLRPAPEISKADRKAEAKRVEAKRKLKSTAQSSRRRVVRSPTSLQGRVMVAIPRDPSARGRQSMVSIRLTNPGAARRVRRPQFGTGARKRAWGGSNEVEANRRSRATASHGGARISNVVRTGISGGGRGMRGSSRGTSAVLTQDPHGRGGRQSGRGSGRGSASSSGAPSPANVQYSRAPRRAEPSAEDMRERWQHLQLTEALDGVSALAKRQRLAQKLAAVDAETAARRLAGNGSANTQYAEILAAVSAASLPAAPATAPPLVEATLADGAQVAAVIHGVVASLVSSAAPAETVASSSSSSSSSTAPASVGEANSSAVAAASSAPAPAAVAAAAASAPETSALPPPPRAPFVTPTTWFGAKVEGHFPSLLLCGQLDAADACAGSATDVVNGLFSDPWRRTHAHVVPAALAQDADFKELETLRAGLLEDNKDVLSKEKDAFEKQKQARLNLGDDTVQGRAVKKLRDAQAEQKRALVDEHDIENQIARTAHARNEQRQGHLNEQLVQLRQQAQEMERSRDFIQRRIKDYETMKNDCLKQQRQFTEVRDMVQQGVRQLSDVITRSNATVQRECIQEKLNMEGQIRFAEEQIGMLVKHHEAALRQKTICETELLPLEQHTIRVRSIVKQIEVSIQDLKSQHKGSYADAQMAGRMQEQALKQLEVEQRQTFEKLEAKHREEDKKAREAADDAADGAAAAHAKAAYEKSCATAGKSVAERMGAIDKEIDTSAEEAHKKSDHVRRSERREAKKRPDVIPSFFQKQPQRTRLFEAGMLLGLSDYNIRQGLGGRVPSQKRKGSKDSSDQRISLKCPFPECICVPFTTMRSAVQHMTRHQVACA